jgi:peptide/nickel transport system substrate-binding protein
MTDLIGRIKKELDQKRRDELIHQALALYKQDIAQLPLYDQEIAWAARDNVHLDIRPDDQFEAKWVMVGQ